MQIIGIYINGGDSCVLKNLSSGWYPFGNFSDCHNKDKYSNVLKEISDNQKFINELYRLDDKNTSMPKINLSCIVGKNGSGKSTLLDIYYRIINNFAHKINTELPDANRDYSPTWATGINAELFFENNDKLLCIKVDNNGSFSFDGKESSKTVSFFDCSKPKDDLFEKTPKEALFQLIRDDGFYTIATNYSLYTNSVVSGKLEDQDKEESWLYNLYHKNDGYFTPIVLVPFKDGRSIDYLKEKYLAEERVFVLSLLMHSENGTDFIENYLPDHITYRIKDTDKYQKAIKEKYDQLFDNKKKDKEQIQSQETLFTVIYAIWESRIDNIKKDDVSKNFLNYVTYKTIKVCIVYEFYSNFFPKKFLEYYFHNLNETIEIVKDKIIPDLSDFKKINYANLKILQCIKFLENQEYYLNDNKNVITVDSFHEYIKHIKTNNDIKTYNDIYINLLPPFFYKEFFYRKISTKKFTTNKSCFRLSDMSSGEEQLLFSLSYMIYHIKNVESNRTVPDRIAYKNVSLLFDEAELYYHPEYQRKFIYNLLNILKRSHLKTKSINITLITHSPFMLSDIPSSNVLCLEDGKVNKNAVNKTLCANFYDLLKNQFFMESSVGAVAGKKIDEIFTEYDKPQEKDYKLEKVDYLFYEKFVNEIDDKYLHKTLEYMLKEIKAKGKLNEKN